MAEQIQKTDTLNQGREKLNAAIFDANIAKEGADLAKATAEQAKTDASQAKVDAGTAVNTSNQAKSDASLAVNTSNEARQIAQIAEGVTEDLKTSYKQFFKGFNGENEIVNGNFVDGTGWTFNAGLTYTIQNKEIVITSVTTQGAQVYKTIPTITGHKYYVSEEMSTNASSDQMYVSAPPVSMYHKGTNQYEKLSSVFTGVGASAGLRLLNSTRTGDLTANPIRIRRVMLVDLTKMYGAGNEPTKEEFEELLKFAFPSTNGWFDGVKEPIMSYEKSFDYLLNRVPQEPPVQSSIKWVAMGDSITARTTGYAFQANKRLNFNLSNMGVGGTSMAVRGGEFESFDPNCFIRKVDTIIFTQYDYLTIGYGTNDWSSDVPIGEIGGAETTFKGAMSKGIEKILASNPKVRILIISPPYRQNAQYRTNELGLYLTDYIKALKEVAESYNLKFLDTYHQSGINYHTWTTYTSDGLHPNDLGAERIGQLVVGEMMFM